MPGYDYTVAARAGVRTEAHAARAEDRIQGCVARERRIPTTTGTRRAIVACIPDVPPDCSDSATPPSTPIGMFTLRIVLCATLAAAFPCTNASGQVRYRIERVATSSGLSQSSVYAVEQDRFGYLWIGTRDGLNRYDGYEFRVFRHTPFEPASLGGVTVTSISADHEGNLWLRADAGVDLLNRSTMTFTHLDATPFSTQRVRESQVTAVTAAPPGGGLICAAGTLYYVHPRTLMMTPIAIRVKGRDDTSAIRMRYVTTDPSGTIWAVSSLGVLYNNGSPNSAWRVAGPLHDSTSMMFLGTQRRHEIYAGSTSRPGHGEQVVHCTDDGRVRHVAGRLFADTSLYRELEVMPLGVTTDRVIWYRLRALRTLDRYTGVIAVPAARMARGPLATDELERWRVANNARTSNMFEDRSGVIWIGTDNGLLRVMRSGARFESIGPAVYAQRPAHQCAVRAVLPEADGGIWLGTDEGASRFDPLSQSWKTYRRMAPRSDQVRSVNVIFRDEDGTILFGTSSGIARYDHLHDRMEPMPIRAPGHATPAIFSLMRTRDRRLWIGSRDHGVLVVDSTGTASQPFAADPIGQVLRRQLIWRMHQDRRGRLWFATAIGLFCDPGNGSRLIAYYHSARTESLPHNNVCGITETGDGTLWFATYGGGIARFVEPPGKGVDRPGSFATFSSQQGLPSDAAYAVIPDAGGRLWVSTNSGLCAVNVADGSVRTYTEADGLQGNDFGFGAAGSVGDTLFFGGPNGVSWFRPEALRDNTIPPTMAITAVQILGHEIQRELHDGDTLEIAHDENYVTLEFAALDFTNTAANRYRYRMNGLHAAWVDCGAHRTASFSNLDPGAYTFTVAGTNNDGVWCIEPVTIHLHVVPPWYLTTWFKALLIAGALGGLAAAVWLRLRTIHRREQMERRSAELALMALRAQMNPHFIFNALASIQHLIATDMPDRAMLYLGTFSRLIRSALENSRLAAVPLADELESLRLYLELESLRFGERLHYTITVDPAVAIDEVTIPTMLMQPYVENAINHGLFNRPDGGTVTITLKRDAGRLVCIVEDDGIGRAAAALLQQRDPTLSPRSTGRRSLGMSVTGERIAMLRATTGRRYELRVIDLHDENGEPRGTRVELIFPMDPSSNDLQEHNDADNRD